MRLINRSIVLALLLAFTATGMEAGEIVDRIVAKVNGHPLLKSDWEQELAFEAFLNGRAMDSLTASERKAALERLIDQELLREQVRPSGAAPADAVAARIGEARKLYPRATSEAEWRAIMAQYGLTERELEEHLSQDIQLMRLVETHLRPSIQIDARAVENYYQERLLPELRKKGSSEVPLPEVSTRIRELLAEQKMNELIANWLESLRSESRISTAGEGEQNR